MPRQDHHRFRGSLTASLVVLSANLATPALASDIPQYTPKPDSWSTGLISNDGVVWDTEFAKWVQTSQNSSKAAVAGNWSFQVRCSFAHCYAGGFVSELKNVSVGDNNLKDFAAASASRYFETASADESDRNPANWYSRFAQAFSDRAADGAAAPKTLEQIVEAAYLAMKDGGVATIKKNPYIAHENAQYNASVDADDLKSGDLKLAILFAGDPERRHQNNLTTMRDVLKTKYGFVDANIWIMYGNFDAGDNIPNAAWKSNAKATHDNLKDALTKNTGFVIDRITSFANGRALRNKKVKLFIWTTNHGTVDAPITISVDSASLGFFGTGVWLANFAGLNPQEFIYDAGGETNSYLGGSYQNDAGVTVPLDSISTGFDEVTGSPGVYFSVGEVTGAVENTGISHTMEDLRDPSSQIYAMCGDGDNREVIRAEAMGLSDDPFDPDGVDDVTALAMAPGEQIIDGQGNYLTTFFFTLTDSPKIYVIDPWHPTIPGKQYVFWDPARDGWEPGKMNPGRLDGLSMYVNVDMKGRFKPDPTDPASMLRKDDLVFKKGIDTIVFSVPNNDPFDASGCTIFRWNGMGAVQVLYTCSDLGLLDGDEVDALDTYDKFPYRVRASPSQNDPIPYNPGCPGDIDRNGMVDGADLGLLLSCWGQEISIGDLNQDGIVDAADLGILLAEWGRCP